MLWGAVGCCGGLQDTLLAARALQRLAPSWCPCAQAPVTLLSPGTARLVSLSAARPPSLPARTWL